MLKFWWIPLLTLLCACRQADVPPERATRVNSKPPSDAPRPTDTADARPVIVCFGDSLTAGFGVDPGKSYPEDLQQELDRRGYHDRVVNLGVSGDTTQDGLARLPLALAENPQIVVLEFGANDGLRGQ